MVSYRRHLSSHRTSTTVKPSHYIAPVTRSLEDFLDSDAIMADIPLFPVDTLLTRRTPECPRSVPANEQAMGGIPPRVAERLANTATQSTPRRGDIGTESDHHSGSAVRADDDERNLRTFHLWKQYHQVFDSSEHGGTIEKFLEEYVPSNAPELQTTEKKPYLYSHCTLLLDGCQAGFGAKKTIRFQDTHSRCIPGPTEYDHATGPDILGWDQYALSMNGSKALSVSASTQNVGTIAQLVKNARNILFASSSCYVFVIGMYSTTNQIRIHRFDHSGSVSCGFNYVEKPHMIREFLWRLVHPCHSIPNTVVGWDETIRLPNDKDMKKMQKVVKRDCRWVKVRLNHDTFISQSGGHINVDQDPPYYDIEGSSVRATYVTRIVLNVPKYGYHEFVMKDAWHQRARKPESAFYERIQERYAELKSKPEFDWVKEIYPDMIWILWLFGPRRDRISSWDDSERGHTTATRRLDTKEESSERTRGRALTGPVGRSLSDFSKTHDLVVAIRDAVVGHFIARSCGVLHRDISNGNVLLAEISGKLQGYLHDFDYATFLKCDFGLEKPGDNDTLKSQPNPHKELTGTQQFMAMDVLAQKGHEPHHDIESFYWVLVWILLRHSDHNHEYGKEACTKLFDHADKRDAKTFKEHWLLRPQPEPLTITNNPPLNALLKDLRSIVRRPLFADDSYTNHKEFVETLQRMINVPGWPTEEDSSKDYNRQEQHAKQAPVGSGRLSSVISARISGTPNDEMDADDVAVETAVNVPLPKSFASEPPQSQVSSVNSGARRSNRLAMALARVSAQIDSPVPAYVSSSVRSSQSRKRRSSAIEEDGSPRKKRR
ncbi:hypothetical protein BDQ17DRAFT_1361412 [Cyathus striatus]|nr:hypothetical protein BDQ17DRAFT_1361412 [Cyathus striatus]